MEKKTSRKTFRFLMKEVSQIKLRAVGMIIFRIGTAILGLVPAIYYKEIVDLISQYHSGSPEVVIHAVAILLLVLWIKLIDFILWRIYDIILVDTETKLQKKLYLEAFEYLQKHSVNFFANNFSGSLIKRTSKFTSAVEGIIDTFLFDILSFVINIVFILIVLGQENIYFSIGFLVWVIIVIGSQYLLFKWIYPHQQKANALDSQVSGELSDTITNYMNLKIFSSLEREKRNLEKLTESVRKARNGYYFRSMAIWGSVGLAGIILEIGIFYGAIHLRGLGKVSVGIFVLLQMYVMRLIQQMFGVGHIMRHLSRMFSEIQEMLEVLESPHEVVDQSSTKAKITHGKVEFKAVDFSYDGENQVFDQLSFDIKAGQRIALVGPSGGGKTTIGKLLFRFYDLQGGKILIDGQDIAQVSQNSLRSQIGMIPQDPILFHRSLRENIAYGKPNATEEEIISAAKMARCFEFIDKLPNKFDTLVGERGIKLSGGERQRVAIARAILQNAPILVMDEATSALDSESEHLIQEAMEELMQNKTVIMVAHRLSTIMKMDKIFVIEQGKIVEKGSHKELLLQQGIYEKLREIQSGGFLQG